MTRTMKSRYLTRLLFHYIYIHTSIKYIDIHLHNRKLIPIFAAAREQTAVADTFTTNQIQNHNATDKQQQDTAGSHKELFRRFLLRTDRQSGQNSQGNKAAKENKGGDDRAL